MNEWKVLYIVNNINFHCRPNSKKPPMTQFFNKLKKAYFRPILAHLFPFWEKKVKWFCNILPKFRKK